MMPRNVFNCFTFQKFHTMLYRQKSSPLHYELLKWTQAFRSHIETTVLQIHLRRWTEEGFSDTAFKLL